MHIILSEYNLLIPSCIINFLFQIECKLQREENLSFVHCWTEYRAGMSQSVCVSLTEYHRLGGLNKKHLFVMVLEVGKSKIKVQAYPVSCEGTLSGVQISLLWFHTGRVSVCVAGRGEERENKSILSWFFL